MKKIIIILTIFLPFTVAKAQDTLKDTRFDYIKVFQPTLVDIIKIASNPNPEVPDVKPPKLDYTLPETRLGTDPTIYTIKPLSMGTAVLPKLKTNYFRLGYGNYNAPLMEAYLNTVRNKTSQAGIYFRHYSANPSSDNNENRSFSDNALRLWGKRFLAKGLVSTAVGYNRNVVHYYGYQPESLALPKRDLRRQYGSLDLHAGYSNIVKDTAKLKFNLDASFYNFVDNRNSVENDFKLTGNFGKQVNGNPLGVAFGINTNNTKTTAFDYSRVFVDINPTYTLNFKQAYILVGFNSTIFNDSNNSKFYFFPKAEVSYQVIPKTITAFGGLTGNLKKNTYRGIANENRFISALHLYNTINSFEFYAGIKGEISAQTSFMVRFSHATVSNMLFYGFDSATYGQRTVYDTTSSGLTNITGELNHEFGERFHFQFTANYFGYSLELPQPYSRPTFTTRTSLMYNIGDKFIIRGDLYTMNKRKGIEYPGGTEVELGAITDVNLGIDYRYTKHVGLFLNFNNITNNEYQRWYNYKVFGFNALGGISVTF